MFLTRPWMNRPALPCPGFAKQASDMPFARISCVEGSSLRNGLLKQTFGDLLQMEQIMRHPCGQEIARMNRPEFRMMVSL